MVCFIGDMLIKRDIRVLREYVNGILNYLNDIKFDNDSDKNLMLDSVDQLKSGLGENDFMILFSYLMIGYVFILLNIFLFCSIYFFIVF